MDLQDRREDDGEIRKEVIYLLEASELNAHFSAMKLQLIGNFGILISCTCM